MKFALGRLCLSSDPEIGRGDNWRRLGGNFRRNFIAIRGPCATRAEAAVPILLRGYKVQPLLLVYKRTRSSFSLFFSSFSSLSLSSRIFADVYARVRAL